MDETTKLWDEIQRLWRAYKDHVHTGSDTRKVRASDIDGLAGFVTDNAPALTPDTVNMVVGASISALEVLYEDNYGFHLKADSDTFETCNRVKGVAAAAAVGATESGVGAGSAHEHYEVTTSTDYVAGNTTPATIIAAASNTNTSSLDSSNDTDEATTTTTSGRYCYQLIRWDANNTATDTIQRIKVLVEASAGGTGQTDGWSCYVWDITNSQWDIVGTSSLAYGTDETIQKAFTPTDYVETTTNYVYVLIKTTGTESGGVNALNLDVDYASLMVGVNCSVYIRGDIPGFTFSASDVGLTAYVSGTAGAVTTLASAYVKVKARVGTVMSTSVLLLDVDPEPSFKPRFVIPKRSAQTVQLADAFGQSDTAGRIAHGYMNTSSVLWQLDVTPWGGDGLTMGTPRSFDSLTVTNGSRICDICVAGSAALIASEQGGTFTVWRNNFSASGGGAAWSVSTLGSANGLCSDGTYVYVYDSSNTDTLHRRLFSTGAAPGSGTNTIDLTLDSGAGVQQNSVTSGVFYLNGYVYVISMVATSSTDIMATKVAKVPVDFSTVTVTTLISDTTENDITDFTPDKAVGYAYRYQDFIMPFNDGQVYIVHDMGNFFTASLFCDLRAF